MEVDYFYRVTITAWRDSQREKYQKDFREDCLLRSKEKAESYWNSQLDSFDYDEHFIDIITPEEWKELEGVDIKLSLVECLHKNGEREYFFSTNKEDSSCPGREKEEIILASFGYKKQE